MALTDVAIERIKEMILSGELKPGDRLPREADLADRLGLSRSSLREAVRALSLMRVLDVRQGDGTYVTSLEPGLLLETMGFIVDLHRGDSIVHLFEVRRLLEAHAAARAAIVMSDPDADALLRLVDEPGPDPSVENLVANDVDFHRTIAAASGNPALCSLLDSLSSQTLRARIWRGLTQKNAVARTLAEHRAIAQAIRAHDPDVASAWATVHIAGVEQWLREALDNGDLGARRGVEGARLGAEDGSPTG